ncbi:hypothetical protein OMCYN_01810 [cyanobiont of Ornithocercus magnificus]|nr:hypothetical protein OMCYN_01810 [cyanobiont of Ornithocercus magnificus]
MMKSIYNSHPTFVHGHGICELVAISSHELTLGDDSLSSVSGDILAEGFGLSTFPVSKALTPNVWYKR